MIDTRHIKLKKRPDGSTIATLTINVLFEKEFEEHEKKKPTAALAADYIFRLTYFDFFTYVINPSYNIIHIIDSNEDREKLADLRFNIVMLSREFCSSTFNYEWFDKRYSGIVGLVFDFELFEIMSPLNCIFAAIFRVVDRENKSRVYDITNDHFLTREELLDLAL